MNREDKEFLIEIIDGYRDILALSDEEKEKCERLIEHFQQED